MELVVNTTTLDDIPQHGLGSVDLDIIKAVQNGLPLVSRPYRHIADQIGIDENTVVDRLRALQDAGVVKRFGVVLRHHELGYRSNAMVVWNVTDSEVQQFTDTLLHFPFITLCYRRPRRLPDWPFNIFSMIHGKDRQSVLENIDSICKQLGPTEVDYKVLFSKRRFKQRGAVYFENNSEGSTQTKPFGRTVLAE